MNKIVSENVIRIKCLDMYKNGIEIDEIAQRLDIPKMVAMAFIERGLTDALQVSKKEEN